MTYQFELILGASTTDEDDERLFERFAGRVSPAVANGTPLLYVHLEASSLDQAIHEAVEGVRELGLSVRRVEADPDHFAADAA